MIILLTNISNVISGFLASKYNFSKSLISKSILLLYKYDSEYITDIEIKNGVLKNLLSFDFN